MFTFRVDKKVFLVIYVRNKPAHGFRHLKNPYGGQKYQNRKCRFINTLRKWLKRKQLLFSKTYPELNVRDLHNSIIQLTHWLINSVELEYSKLVRSTSLHDLTEIYYKKYMTWQNHSAISKYYKYALCIFHEFTYD